MTLYRFSFFAVISEAIQDFFLRERRQAASMLVGNYFYYSEAALYEGI
jgi:hypothetical protein